MKKQKVFILVQHGVDNQDNSCVDVVGVYSTKDSSQGEDGRRGECNPRLLQGGISRQL